MAADAATAGVASHGCGRCCLSAESTACPCRPFWAMCQWQHHLKGGDAGCLECEPPSPHQAVEVGPVWCIALIAAAATFV